MGDERNGTGSRRAFLGAAAAGFVIVKPGQVRGSAANSAIRLGLIGCGGRGRTVARSFATNTTARVVALGDLFQDQLEGAKKQFDAIGASKGYAAIDRRLMFRGPRAYQQLVASPEIDMVQISTPDYFHPLHLEAAVAAGKHVYCEKPVAVDVTGARRVVAIGEKARGRLSLDVGFQIRSAPPFVELVRRIHAGALGKIVCAAAHYHATSINYPPRGNVSPLELRIRNWYWDRVISGDIMVDQNIHVIDICNWVLKAHPVKAVGVGGRRGRTDFGNCFDHFQVSLTYPDDVHVSFNSIQYGNKLWDVSERFFGTRGVSDSPYSGPLRIEGDEPWQWQGESAAARRPAAGGQAFSVTGEFSNNLEFADREKDKAFIESIVSGQYHNQAALGAESALSAMLAREAAYTGREVVWDEFVRSNQAYDAGLDLDKLG